MSCAEWARWALSVGGGWYTDERGELVIIVPREYASRVPPEVLRACRVIFTERFRVY
jgi:hypothetical protein